MAGTERVTVIGAGTMGSQIAMVCARAGIEVAVHDVDPSTYDRARRELEARMERNVAKGRLTAEDRDAAFARLRFVADLAEAAADADVVIEAAVEKLEVKRELFSSLDRTSPERTILASNTSSFVPSRLADATGRADRVAVMHFFNPALVMPCVEVVRGPQTSDGTVDTITRLAERLGKQPVVLDKEIPGFVANRILNAVRDEAIRLHEGGYASVEAIDTACRTALGYPMGPFELMDLTGELVQRGHLGRKTGHGWYEYDENGQKVGGA